MSEFPEFQNLLNRTPEERDQEFQRHGRLKHLIFGSQLTPDLLDRLCRSADMIRRLARDREGNAELRNLLPNRRAMLYFTQPSTRTFLSFMAACQILGITCNEVRDPKMSSEVKRESRTDSVRMFSSYFDVIIMRSQMANLAEVCAYMMNDLEGTDRRSVPIINAGAGSDEHPTQALLDMYTILRTFDFDENSLSRPSRLASLQNEYPSLTTGAANKTYAFCGDIKRGRTVRSLATVLSQYHNVTMYFITPPHDQLRIDDDLRSLLETAGVTVKEFESLEETVEGQPILEKIDCLYMTRIQREHNSNETEAEIDSIDLSPFKLSVERVAKMKSFAPILHPFPRDSIVGEIPTEIDSDPRAMYFRQARNGMWARAALLVHLFDVNESLMDAHVRLFPAAVRSASSPSRR
jgi:aspartate carbamoyltransferase